MGQKISDPDSISEPGGYFFYASELRRLLNDIEKKYGYNDLDSLLVLKDILAKVWKNRP